MEIEWIYPAHLRRHPEVKMLACRQVSHSSVHCVQKANAGMYIYSLPRENATPSQNKSGKTQQAQPLSSLPDPQYAHVSADKKLSPLQDAPQRPRVTEWREKMMLFLTRSHHSGHQNCRELSSMTRMCRKFLTLPN